MTTTQQEPSAVPGIKIICAGLGRTGTLSLTEAFEILGYKPYHFVAISHAKQWASVARGESQVDQVIDLIVKDGYDTVLDNPCCDIYRDILKRYPEAKVILTVRDTPEKFEASWKALLDTMLITEQPFRLSFPSFFGWIPLFRNLKEIRYMMGTTHLQLEPGELTHGWREKESGWLGDQYERHNRHIRDHVRNDQLLVFNVKDGWKPLCDFIGCKVPDKPFPHSTVNDSKALKNLRRTFLITVYGWIPIVVSCAVGGLWLGARVGRPRVRLMAKKRH